MRVIGVKGTERLFRNVLMKLITQGKLGMKEGTVKLRKTVMMK